jgi:hypothetical protein
MLKGLGIALVVIVIAAVAAAAMPLMHVVSVYREWSWEGGPASRAAILHG